MSCELCDFGAKKLRISDGIGLSVRWLAGSTVVSFRYWENWGGGRGGWGAVVDVVGRCERLYGSTRKSRTGNATETLGATIIVSRGLWRRYAVVYE